MRITGILSAVTVAATVSLLSSCQVSEPSFVRVEDGKFVCDNTPSYYIGANFWYGAILGSEGQGGDRARLEAELDTLKALGVTNLRVLVGGDGPDGIPTRIMPTLQKEPGVYDDTIFRGLDFLLAEMGKRGMKAVLYINNSWEWSGGYGMYLEWAGAGKSVIPSIDGYQAYMESVSKFMTNDRAKELFTDHVKHVVTRTNTVTGRKYKDDSAIFSWQIGNEPRCFSDDKDVQQAFVDFMWSTASLIKSLDPNHMVSSGSEGKWGCEVSMELFEKIHSCPDIDYMNIHVWPYNWNWVRETTLSANLGQALENTDAYIDEHLKVAEKYGKPVVLEEFGFPRDDFKFTQGTPTTARDTYYKHVFGRIAESCREGGLFAGVNFWGWGGFAGQSSENIYWMPGDDYCGDPAQEQQGLNSVYACDATTVAVIKEASEAVRAAMLPSAWFFLDGNSGIFTSDAPHSLRAGLHSPHMLTARLVLDLSTDFGRPAGTFTREVKFLQWGAEVEFDLNLEPGFYKAVLSIEEKDGTKQELTHTNLGCCPELISSPQDKQPDFDEFWGATLEELAGTDASPKLTLVEEYSDDVRRTWRVDMTSLSGERISGVLVEPVAPGKSPAIIHYMGYGSDVWYSDPSSNPQMTEFTLCIRNQALNRKPGEKDDWCTRGLESKDTYYYRGAFADAVRAVDFVCSREKTDTSRVFANGESQGGALTLVAASLDRRIKAIAPSAPFLNDYRDYFSLVHWPADPILAAAREKGIGEDDLYRTLSYFDVKNFTDRITCPVLMAIGLQDPVCPPHTNFAGYNMINSEKRWICYPSAGHNVWEQQGWQKEKDEFFRRFI